MDIVVTGCLLLTNSVKIYQYFVMDRSGKVINYVSSQ